MRTAFATLLALAAGAASAQDVASPDSGAALRAALVLCLREMSDPVAAGARLVQAGWQARPDAEGYTVEYVRPEVSVFFAADASACTVVGHTTSTVSMARAFGDAAAAAGIDTADAGPTEMGCPAADLRDGRIATINEAAPDPGCDSETSAMVTVYVAGG